MTTVSQYLVTFLLPSAAVLVGGLALQVVPALIRQRTLGLPGLDGIRVESAVLRYRWWLSWLGAGDDLRKGLVTGLRADLSDSARDVGGRAAVRRLGPLRPAAQEAVAAEDERYRRPRWGWGVSLGVVAAVLALTIELLMATAWWGAAQASAVDVTGSLPLFVNSTISWSGAAGADLSVGPTYPIVFLAVFAVTIQPWRFLRRPR